MQNYTGITLLSCPGKAFAHVLLAQVKDKLLCVHRTEQSRFTPQRSTVDHIALLNLLLQGSREHGRSLWIIYINLPAAFDSVDCNTLWLLLRSHDIPPKLVDMFKDLYTDTVSCVHLEGEVSSDWFYFSCGVRQGCTVAPS